MPVRSLDALSVINLTIVTEIDAKIREIPYGTGSRFIPDKGCLAGTRMAFLDFIVDWVDDPTSERCLVLFGQAGTGKSSIAHEVARRFSVMHRLTSLHTRSHAASVLCIVSRHPSYFCGRSNQNVRHITSSRLSLAISPNAILHLNLRLEGP